jgi:hypothetical protein
MSLSRASPAEANELGRIPLQATDTVTVDPKFVGCHTHKKRKFARAAARLLHCRHIFKSRSCSWWAKHNPLPVVCVMGGVVLHIHKTGAQVLAVYNTTVLTVTTPNNHVRVVTVCQRPGLQSNLFHIKSPISAVRAVVQHSPVSCKYSPSWGRLVSSAAQEQLTVWTRALTENVGISVFQSKSNAKLVCVTCGQSFDTFDNWQRHSGNAGTGPEAFMQATKTQTGQYCLLPGKLRVVQRPIRNGFTRANPADVARLLHTVAARATI